MAVAHRLGGKPLPGHVPKKFPASLHFLWPDLGWVDFTAQSFPLWPSHWEEPQGADVLKLLI